MADQAIVKMETMDLEHEGQTITVVGVPSHRTTDTADAEGAYSSVWLQDGVAVEVLFDEETWKRHEIDLLAAAVLVRGRVEWRRPHPDSPVKLMRLRAEYAEPRELVGITTEAVA